MPTHPWSEDAAAELAGRLGALLATRRVDAVEVWGLSQQLRAAERQHRVGGLSSHVVSSAFEGSITHFGRCVGSVERRRRERDA